MRGACFIFWQAVRCGAMLNLARLFGKSPFAPLQSHMKKVAGCVAKLPSLFELLEKGDLEKLEKVVSELSKIEHEADMSKNDIRNHLPKSLFLPIDRAHFLEILAIQDKIADQAEDVGILLTLSPIESFPNAFVDLKTLSKKNAEVFDQARQIIAEIDELLEASFGGIEAEKVKAMVEKTAFLEHEADKFQKVFLKRVFSHGASLSTPSFYLWVRLIQEVGTISHLSEKLANRIRMILELK